MAAPTRRRPRRAAPASGDGATSRPGSARYVVFPSLSVRRRRGRTEVENVVYGTRLRSTPAIEGMLDACRAPISADALARRFHVTAETLRELLELYILVPEHEMSIVATGLCRERSPAIGPHAAIGALVDQRPHGYAVVGAPVDFVAGGDGGARNGPAAIRGVFPKFLPSVSGGSERVAVDLEMRKSYSTHPSVVDLGDVMLSPGEGNDVFADRYQRVVRAITTAGHVPVTIGGDHSVSWFALDVLLARHPALGIIHFDAHHDLYPQRRDPPLLAHSNPFVFALARASLRHLRQLGLRTFDATLSEARETVDPRLTYWSSYELRRMSPEEALGDLPTDIPYYLTFDVDVLDPSIAPATGTPSTGGLSYYQALELLTYAYGRFDLVGADFVEVAGGHERKNLTAAMVAQFMLRLFYSRVPSRPLRSALATRRPA